ncbi:MAG: DNA protecting protein DprA [Candidatus Andersenbacteria bacterium RIFCSPHIGHO2_02_FULL_45_11]|nr:MAG: DNA protecting protein DprA [Candidatus Andersenbacteria bacterium RIFCSPHIGHO2_02_FULL_45_11]
MSFEIGILPASDSSYPALLTQIHKPPQQLYYRGDISLLNRPNMLAVVGSRKATMYGRQAIAKLLPPCIRSGIIIVSGMAYGIDSIAHRTCIELGAPTVAVLGSGVDDKSLYPRGNKTLAQEILAGGGLIISEYEPGTTPYLGHFPARNRIIAGITKATLIIQAAIRSGSLITSRLAMESNREVLAVPGPITDPACEGTNILIRDGATPVFTASDILSVFELSEATQSDLVHTALREDLQIIVSALSATPLYIDDIAHETGVPITEVSAALVELEMIGVITNMGGMKYVKA